ncbi:4-hydroxybenzoate octaprenyltransferase [Nitrospira sp. KM1]|uniref:4-hydroxybenzoate octaprenyltransferase n=1 Tax=Nitrospira sp. KM1 TaxID=1936990 RepID=UPI0013A7863C|nr:4-hydroxybenzoate octaprenyltransferase [Nitrospira sp. KM1]BCA55946.1 4-hydroxybenzoate octaprenyltransferase [Nitrospira sp. KM1]
MPAEFPSESIRPSVLPSWSAVARLIRLQSQTGTLLLLLPTWWSLILASRGVPPWKLLAIFSLGSFLMRSAGVVLNDLADRSFDRHVSRTRLRPLASGEMTVKQATAIAAVLVAAAAGLVLLLNPLAMLLSPIALLLAALYPFAKRIIHVPQTMLGIAFGWGTIMAWAAARETLDSPAWLVFAATVFWAIGYDTIYALQDVEDDLRIGVKSSALFFGRISWIAVGVALAAMLFLLGLAGWMSAIGRSFFVVLAGLSLVCLGQVFQLRTALSPSRAFELFHRHVWFGSVIAAGLLTGFYL